MPNNINISFTVKETPSVDITIGEEAKRIISLDTTKPSIEFVATGHTGPQGIPGTASIGAGEVTHVHLATDSVGTDEIINGSVGYDEIAAGAIRGSKIQSEAITTDKILDGAVTAAKLADGIITDAVVDKLSDGVISNPKIKDLAISSGKIQNNSITTSKISDGTITAVKIQNKSLTGGEIVDNVELGGTTKVTAIKIQGESPGYIYGPTNDTFYIKSEKDLIFVCDSDQSGGVADTSNFRFQNYSGTNLFVIDESGNTTISGNVDITGNITLSGTVDGIDIATAVAANTAKQTITNAEKNKINYLTVTQAVDLDAMETKLDGISTGAQVNHTLIDDDTMATASSTNVASAESIKAYVDTEVSGIVDSAPNTLNTLNELADALGDDENFSTTVTNNIATKQPILSEGAFADGDKTKLDGIATGATANTGDVTLTTTQTISGNKILNNLRIIDEEDDGTPGIRFYEASNNGSSYITLSGAEELDGNYEVVIPNQSGDLALTSQIPVDLTVSGAGTVHANNYTDTQYSVMSSGNSYAAGLVPAGASVHGNNFLRKDGTFAIPYIYLGMDGIALSFNQISVDLKANGGLVIESGKIALDLGASSITNNLTIPPDLTSSGTGTVHADNYTNTTYSEATSSAEGLMSTAHHDKLDGIAAGATAYTDADAVSAVATADDYLKNDASDTLDGSLTINQSIFLVDSGSGATGTKSKIVNRVTTGNRTLDVPDASGVLALTNSLIDTKTAAYWSSSTSGFYITLSGASTSENTSLSTASYTLMYVAPFDGKIKRISSFHQSNVSGTSTFEIYIDGDDSDLTNDQRGSDMTTSTYTRKFTEDCPSDWTFSKGEAIAIKRTDSVAKYGVTMTIVFEYDTTT